MRPRLESFGRPVLLVLGHIVCDLMPRCLGADEDMTRRPNSRVVVERSCRNHDSIELSNHTGHRAAASSAEDIAETLGCGQAIGIQQVFTEKPAEVFGFHE